MTTTTTTPILFRLSQSQAISRGYNAPQSTVRIDVPVQDLRPDEREILVGEGSMNRLESQLCIPEPTLGGVREAIQLAKVERDKREDARRKHQAERAAREAQEERDQEAWRCSTRVARFANILPDGKLLLTTDAADRAVASCEVFVRQDPPPEIFSSLKKERTEEIDGALASAHDLVLSDLYATWRAERDAEEAAQKERYAELLHRLPASLRERIQAGFAADGEEEEAVLQLLIADAGFDPDSVGVRWGARADVTHHDDGPVHLDDSQYALYKALAEKLERANALLRRRDLEFELLNAYWYRPATDDDPVGDIDEDREVREDHKMLWVRWPTPVGVRVEIYLPLSE